MSSDIDPLTLVQPAASRVRDPVSGRSIWLAGVVRNPHLADDVLRLELVLTPEHTDYHVRGFQAALGHNLKGLGWDGQVQVAITREGEAAPAAAVKPNPTPVKGMAGGGMQPHGGPIQKKRLPGVQHVVLVASGKGGVGKSTVATNLAVGLQKLGYRTGLMDADVYGPSLPKMMNLSSRPMVDAEKKIIPPLAYGVRCMSMGLLVDQEEAVIWRGPMVMGAVKQFLQDSLWGELDVLIVDMPPGTGDAQLTLIQAVDIAGAVIVTTPQDVALLDAIRGISMFRKLDVPLLGLVENMAWYPLPDGTRDYVFGENGGRRTAERYDTPLLAQIPLQTSIRRGGDAGVPAVLGDDEVALGFRELARAVAGQLRLKEVPA